MSLVKVLPFLLLLLDASRGSREPALAVERLGSSYGYLQGEEDRGLAVEAWSNESLGRRELWHKPDGDYFLRVDANTYVLGRFERSEWVTDPATRLVFRKGAWIRLERQPVRR
jgi:hypothetical protein